MTVEATIFSFCSKIIFQEIVRIGCMNKKCGLALIKVLALSNKVESLPDSFIRESGIPHSPLLWLAFVMWSKPFRKDFLYHYTIVAHLPVHLSFLLLYLYIIHITLAAMVIFLCRLVYMAHSGACLVPCAVRLAEKKQNAASDPVIGPNSSRVFRLLTFTLL